MQDNIKKCLICQKIFTAPNKTLYCSEDCKKAAMRVINRSNAYQYIIIRKRRFLALQQYVERNNLKRILKKYKPKKINATNERKNDNN